MHVLILTLILKSGYGGMGGIESLELPTLNDCERIGTAWVEQVKRNRGAGVEEAFYLCLRKDGG